MKIAYIYDAVYPYVKGGVEKRIYEISKRLAEKGHEVHWFGIKWWDGDDAKDQNKVCLHGVCEPKELYVEGRRSIKEALYFAWKLLFRLKRNFDIIDCQEFPYFPCFSAKFNSLFKRTLLVITWHEVWGNYWYEYLGKKGFFGKTVEKLTTKLTSRNVAVSERTKKELERFGVREEIEVIPNGIDFWDIQNVRASEEESDVIFVGRLMKEKNVDVLIKAISLVKKEVPDIKCIIIGDGPERRRLENLANDFKINKNIKFTGFLEDYDEVISYEKSSKVFVLPSIREGFGIVALEANACGLPVVTVNHRMNAACDFISNGNGFTCKFSEEDVAEKILTALDRRKNMARKCIEKAKMYDWDKISSLVESFYGDVER